MTPERLAEIEQFLATACFGAPSSFIALEMARDLLTALRETQQQYEGLGQDYSILVNQIINERDALQVEVTRLKKFIADYDVMEPIELRDVRRERDALQRRVERLETFAQHKFGCSALPPGAITYCSCGLEAALRSGETG